MTLKRWQDWVNVILGAWMIVSPWILGFAANDNIAAQSAWTLGAAIVVFAGIAVYMHKAWEEAVNIILGLCLLASPWLLGFVDQLTPTSNAAIVGLLVTAFALWSMFMDTAVQKWWHEHYGAHAR
jgi:SPW repeat